MIESREQLKHLKAIDCRMAHERVLFDRKTQLPIAGSVPEIEFQRVGLCDSAKRFKNPACSHTMARYPIENALNFLEQHGEYSEWRVEFNDLNNTIHRLDHEKGEVEKQLAQVIQKIGEPKSSEADLFIFSTRRNLINEQIAEIEQRHSVCAEKIENLKNNILTAINSAIEIEENSDKR